MNYNFITEPVKPKTVTVITPTIGSSKLQDAIDSVQRQTYEFVQHLIVIDGEKYFDDTMKNSQARSCTKYTTSPENTGANGFYGHRIYAAYPHLINSDYIFFLDEDNWYEPNHVETLVKTLDEGNEFAYSLRKIYNDNKTYLCDDNCESLGKWPIYFTHEKPEYLIDTSSFAFRREFLIQVSQLWHSGWGGDRRFYNIVRDKAKHDTSGKHTLCYRLDGNTNSVKPDFFEQGNEDNHRRYNGKFPWIKD
jgi:glycosyltransferase involved in cell wall biosynthesis